MNKQLERDLLCSIQSLKAFQLQNVLTQFVALAGLQAVTNVAKKGMHYECEIRVASESARGFGRTDEQSISNATKGLFSLLIGKNIEVDKITKSLKSKNGNQPKEQVKDHSLILDDISMIHPSPIRGDFLEYQEKEPQTKDRCDCIYYNMHQYSQNEVKHLQARVSLLTEENLLLKKMLLCGSRRPSGDSSEKENSSYQGNSVLNGSDRKLKL